MKEQFQNGDYVQIHNIPWRGVIGRYVRKCWWGHRVMVGDLISGGTPRVIRVGRVSRASSPDMAQK
jgi:hypothetical protein